MKDKKIITTFDITDNYLNFNRITPANCIPKEISSPPAKKTYTPSFKNIKSIIDNNDFLTLEEKEKLLKKIFNLYV